MTGFHARGERITAGIIWGGLIVGVVLWGSLEGTTHDVAVEPVPGYEASVQRLDDVIGSLTARASRNASDWFTLGQLAAEYLERARLTGSLDDYRLAERAIDTAFERAPHGAGPFLLRARLNFAMHRFERIEPDLQAAESRVLVDDHLRAAIEGLHADVALLEGRLEEAGAGFERALALHDDMTGRARLARFLWITGDVARAEHVYREALGRYHGQSPQPVAWTHLQLGLMDLESGRLDAAMEHYRDADAALPGWWLIEEHMAEAMASQGPTRQVARGHAIRDGGGEAGHAHTASHEHD